MRAVKIVVEPFEFISYLKLQCTKEVNQHGIIKITGIIKQENYRKYIEIATREIWVNVNAISEDEEIRRFFVGILTGLDIKKEGQVYVMSIEVRTGSFLLDVKSHIRSFQSTGMLYSEVLNICMKSAEGVCTMLEKKDEVTKQFLLQYQETDWEFIKRLATYAETVIIPEDSMVGKKIYWGYKQSKISEKFHPESYQMEQDYEWYERKKALGVENLKSADIISYIVTDREIYNLGENVQFEGMDFVIARIDSWLDGQELYHKYRLITKVGGVSMPIYNYNISGVSLKAFVTAVEKTVVKIQIEEDENKADCRNCWLDYATVYSTPDGTGWYCMPEIGDEVRMVMPDYSERNPYVSGSVHAALIGERINPDEKSWKNRQGKEILFTPDSLILRNNNGMSMELSDQEGIKIISTKDIVVQSDGDVQIKSQGSGINMSAENCLLMQQGVAKIQINNDINISGGKIYMN